MEIKLNERIRLVRKKAGLTQEDLAGKLNIAYQTLNKYEKGHRIPDAGILHRIAIFTNCEDPGWLLTGEKTKAEPPMFMTLEEKGYIEGLLKVLRGRNRANAEAIKWNVMAFAKTADTDIPAEEKMEEKKAQKKGA